DPAHAKISGSENLELLVTPACTSYGLWPNVTQPVSTPPWNMLCGPSRSSTPPTRNAAQTWTEQSRSTCSPWHAWLTTPTDRTRTSPLTQDPATSPATSSRARGRKPSPSAQTCSQQHNPLNKVNRPHPWNGTTRTDMSTTNCPATCGKRSKSSSTASRKTRTPCKKH